MNAEILRIILFLVGLAAVALVFLWESHKRRKTEARLRALRSTRDLPDDHGDQREPLFGPLEHSDGMGREARLDKADVGHFDFPPGVPPDGVRVIRRSHGQPTPSLGPSAPKPHDAESVPPSEVCETPRRVDPPPAKSPGLPAPARPDETHKQSFLVRWLGWPWRFRRSPSPQGIRRRSVSRDGSGDVTGRDTPQLIIQLNVAACHEPFTGRNIVQIVDELGLEAGDMNIFHRYEDIEGQRSIIFSLASMVEPGYFPLNHMGVYSTPGLTLFTQLPGAKDGLAIFSDMLFTAQRLGEVLDGELQDETHSRLTRQVIEHIRGLIQEHRRKTQIIRRP
ncbi:Cell division protein ZipA [Gammaproteobacteria bacterium]